MARMEIATSPPDPSRTPGSLAWERRGFTYRGRLADVGALAVPMRRDRPGSPLIHIPILRYRSTGAATHPPVFHLTGGPGLSNLGLRPSDELLAYADLVLVGYRGVDGSVKLDGPELAAAMRRAEAFDSAEARRGLRDAAIAMFQRHRARGIELEGFTIPEVAADVEDARRALGYDRIHLVSESYGTRVAQVYAQDYGDRVVRSVMVGVNPPGHFVWAPEDSEAVLGELARACAADPTCSTRTPDLAATVRSVLEELPDRWLFLPIDPGRVKAVLFVLLFHRRTAALAVDALLRAAEGDASGVALLSLAFDRVFPRAFEWGDFLWKAVSADIDVGRDYARELAAPPGELGSPLSHAFFAYATQLGVAPIAPRYRVPRGSDVETLFLGGNLDLSTPPRHFLSELAPLHPRSRSLVLRDAGHVADLWHGREDGDARIVRYLATGELLDAAPEPLGFHVRLGLPGAMKGLLLLFAALALLLLFAARAAATWWLGTP